MKENEIHVQLSRRAFLRRGALLMASATGAKRLFAEEPPSLRFGLITDIHYADKEPEGQRFYRESLGKMRKAIAKFDQEKLSLAVELGDLVDAAKNADAELGFLKSINAEFATFNGERHYVLGNHCVTTLTKKQFLDGVGREQAYYSFGHGPFHFVLLDACYREDGRSYEPGNFTWDNSAIPASQLEWLADDLKRTDRKSIVFVHQRLDGTTKHTVRNAAAVREVLEKSGKVHAVFQGHHHVNDHKEINGIHYCTLEAVVDGSGESNNAYAVIDIWPDASIKVAGFRNQKSYRFDRAKKE